jgi:hypothetical protein
VTEVSKLVEEVKLAFATPDRFTRRAERALTELALRAERVSQLEGRLREYEQEGWAETARTVQALKRAFEKLQADGEYLQTRLEEVEKKT